MLHLSINLLSNDVHETQIVLLFNTHLNFISTSRVRLTGLYLQDINQTSCDILENRFKHFFAISFFVYKIVDYVTMSRKAKIPLNGKFQPIKAFTTPFKKTSFNSILTIVLRFYRRKRKNQNSSEYLSIV